MAKIWYKTYNNKVLIIVKVLKLGNNILKICKYKVDIFIN